MSVAPHCTTTHIYGGPGVGRLHGVWGRWRVGGRKTLDVSLLLYITGGAQVTRWVSQYGIKVSSWGSETFKIVIPVENHPQKPKNRLADYHPLWGWGVLISGQIYVLTIYVHIGVVNSGRHDSPHIRKSSLDHDSGEKNRGCNSYF